MDNLTVVTYQRFPDSAELKDIEHGSNVQGQNIVAVLDGDLCPDDGYCSWCASLRDRCKSRRRA